MKKRKMESAQLFLMDSESLRPIDSRSEWCKIRIIEHFEKSKMAAKMAVKTYYCL